MKKRIGTGLLIGCISLYVVSVWIGVWMLLNLTRCAADRNDRAEHLQSVPHPSQAQLMRISENYIYAKYGTDFEAFLPENYLAAYQDWSKPRGQQTYYSIAMHLKNDPDDKTLRESPAQAALNDWNHNVVSDQFPFGNLPYFVVYLDYSGQVIGDQYMWYSVYPLYAELIQSMISESAPCPAALASCSLSACGGVYYVSFPPDFPIITTAEELKQQLPALQKSTCLSVSAADHDGLKEADWLPFEVQMRELGIERMIVKIMSEDGKDFRELCLKARDPDGYDFQGYPMPNY